MSYTVLRTDKANDQLSEIIQYIADDSGDVEVAIRYLDGLEASILRLQDFPESGSLPRYSLLKRQGYRVLIHQRHLIFYKVDKARQQVMVYAIVDGKREYRNLV